MLLIAFVVHLAKAGRGSPTAFFETTQRASALCSDAILLYFFLAAVSDHHGLSFYRDTTIALRLRLNEQAVVAARQELVAYDLAAHRAPLTQILALPKPELRRGRSDAEAVGDLLRQLTRKEPRAQEAPTRRPDRGSRPSARS